MNYRVIDLKDDILKYLEQDIRTFKEVLSDDKWYDWNLDKLTEIINKYSNVKNVSNITYLDRGSYGSVFSADVIETFPRSMIYSNNKVAIKISLDAYYDASQLKFLKKEKDFSYEMGQIGIGPKIYDAFLFPYVAKNTKLRFKQFIIMDYFQENGYKAILNTMTKITENSFISIIEEMIKLVQKMISYGLYCTDIKPENFVVRSINNKIEVKMIDFDSNFCKQKNNIQTDLGKDINENIDDLYQMILIQLYAMIEDIIYEKYPDKKLFGRGKSYNHDKFYFVNVLKSIFCKYIKKDLQSKFDYFKKSKKLQLGYYLSTTYLKNSFELPCQHSLAPAAAAATAAATMPVRKRRRSRIFVNSANSLLSPSPGSRRSRRSSQIKKQKRNSSAELLAFLNEALYSPL